ncbi:MAG: hypothetical protein FJ314_03485 [SAR202 cluster bacterium]|nr:hypothetical protein [SAR202 cluster bacterium]
MLSARVCDGMVCVEVQGQGTGKGTADMARVFTPFFRSDDQATRQVPGTGLGLALVQSIVELHGGEVTVFSEPGSGSKSGFRIPGVLAAA